MVRALLVSIDVLGGVTFAGERQVVLGTVLCGLGGRRIVLLGLFRQSGPPLLLLSTTKGNHAH